MTAAAFKTVCRYAALCIASTMFHLAAPAARAEDAPAGTIVPVSQALCDDMKKHNVIRPGVPVGCERLSLIKFSYMGFDGSIHLSGSRRLPWHDVEIGESRLQVLPRFLRRYPDDY